MVCKYVENAQIGFILMIVIFCVYFTNEATYFVGVVENLSFVFVWFMTV